MGNSSSSLKKVNFENILDFQKSNANGNNKNNIILISTLSQNEQTCLISKTIPSSDEESVINKALSLYYNKKISIYIYGKNSNDMTIVSKAKQLMELGFSNVYIYVGGLFEWLLLQEIYGVENFKTTGEELDLLKYRPQKYRYEMDEQLSLTNFVSNNR